MGWRELPQRLACSKVCRHTRNAQWYQTLAKKYMMFLALARVRFRAAKIVSCSTLLFAVLADFEY
jgi:hypothetical protein